MEIDVNRGKIQISAPGEGQPVLGSGLFAKPLSSAGWLIRQNRDWEPAVTLLPLGEGQRGWGEERSCCGLRRELEGFLGQRVRTVLCQLRYSPKTSTIGEGGYTL